MTTRAWTILVACAVSAYPLIGCRHKADAPPPPDARRPVIKSQAELTAERADRIDAGQVVPTAAPARVEAERKPAPTPRVPAPIQPAPGAIEAEILLVNDTTLTIPEVLYPLGEHLAELRSKQAPQVFQEAVPLLVRDRTQQAVGTLLIYAEATANLAEPQLNVIADGIEREVSARISREFGDSSARFERHLAERGLTLPQYRKLLERELVARQYTREKLMPQITVRRGELMSYYRRNLAEFSTAETRELWLIEAPFEAFLPPDTSWDRAAGSARAAAKLRAKRHIRTAYDALRDRPFDEVAREYSRGVHAAQGGAWGEIGRPLQSPYDVVSRPIFTFAQGQYGDPIETERGWYITRCGQITSAHEPTFSELQEEIRQQVIEKKYERASLDYMVKLADRATISSLESFLMAATRRVLAEEPAAPIE